MLDSSEINEISLEKNYRVADPQEQFSTCLVDLALNSWSLVAAPPDPNDFYVMTSDHFVIGSELKSIPEPDYTTEKFPIRKR
ncbi:hypothetical protein NPIL_655391 [Nephila pilipes]|uniref:Uncharacterized protein n=1 Tax=Nephila pilipes TaxID=299642 RepID=A0A8X6I3B8_NEPPI|nr:hypothetical protein NPIL_655391 [Nephila pilipes]